MFFFALALALPSLWFLPWWSLALLSFLVALATPLTLREVLHYAAGAAAAEMALAFVRDGQSHGLISVRMAGLFSLPTPSLVFLIVGSLAAITVLLALQSGRLIRSRFATSPTL